MREEKTKRQELGWESCGGGEGRRTSGGETGGAPPSPVCRGPAAGLASLPSSALPPNPDLVSPL